MNRNPFEHPGAPRHGSIEDIFKQPLRGGGPRRARPAEPFEPGEMLEPEAPPETDKKTASVVLRNPRWETETVGFNEEALISVEVTIPEPLAHKTRVIFELFAKTPAGPEWISKGEGHARDGKAFCIIPVYIPNHRDEAGNLMPEVEYYFQAKHLDSPLLVGANVTKRVEGMAKRLLATHTLPELAFATGKSFLHPGQAAALQDLGAAIQTWLETYPDGKLGVFGHADAVGQEEPNKALAERRAKSVHAFLLKDAAAWSDLETSEKWGLDTVQDLLRHLGHEPGASNGKDGAKTQAAVKAFQSEKGLLVDGKAGPKTREALYLAFMEGCNPLSLKKARFETMNGGAGAGCGEFNLKEDVKGACEANRRVVVVWVKSNKNFPIHYPCAVGDVDACRRQVARKGTRRTAGFGCFFYDGLVVEGASGPGTKSAVRLKSHHAHEQLTKLATDLSESHFIVMLLPVFGDDIPIASYGRLYRALSDGALPPPTIDVLSTGLDGHEAGFHSGTGKILVSETLAQAAGSEEDARQRLFIALVEEYGHYIDWKLRNEYSRVGGDAKGDEGSAYSYRMAYLDVLAHDALHFADLESEAYSGPLCLDVSSARAGAEKHASREAQIQDDKHGQVEYFGAGIGSGQPGSYGHQSIEEALVDAGFKEDADLHRIYFGNWLRDFSQAVDPAIVRPGDALLAKAQARCKDKPPALDTQRLSREAITKLIGILAWKEFSQEDVPFSLRAKDLLMGPRGMEILGGYRPEEHIDNPYTTDTTDASLVDPVFAKPPTPAQLDVNPVTGLRNHIATPTPGQSFPTAVDYMAGRFRKAMAAGYTDEGLRYFGEGLHVLEDYFSHSNFIEVSYIKLGYTKVVPWVTVAPGTRRIPIVTGCFGRTDVLASVAPKLAGLIPHEIEDYTLIPPGTLTATDESILIVLEDLKRAQRADTTQKNPNYLGLDAATSLDYYTHYLRLRDLVNSGKADWKAAWLFKGMHYGMQGFMVATHFATYMLFEKASHLVDDAQTLVVPDVGLNPTHSQLAKDHDVHHFHGIAAEVAKYAVAVVGKAMHGWMMGSDKSAYPVTVAKSFIQHPLDLVHPDIDRLLREWAAKHPDNMRRAESRTLYEHLHHGGRKEYEKLSGEAKAWRERQKKWLKAITEYFPRP